MTLCVQVPKLRYHMKNITVNVVHTPLMRHHCHRNEVAIDVDGENSVHFTVSGENLLKDTELTEH